MGLISPSPGAAPSGRNCFSLNPTLSPLPLAGTTGEAATSPGNQGGKLPPATINPDRTLCTCAHSLWRFRSSPGSLLSDTREPVLTILLADEHTEAPGGRARMTLLPRSPRWTGQKCLCRPFRGLTILSCPLCSALSRPSGLCPLERIFPKSLPGLCASLAWMRKSPHSLRKPREGKDGIPQRRWPKLKNQWSPTSKPTWPRRFWCAHPASPAALPMAHWSEDRVLLTAT